jgi:hypothetical protein
MISPVNAQSSAGAPDAQREYSAEKRSARLQWEAEERSRDERTAEKSPTIAHLRMTSGAVLCEVCRRVSQQRIVTYLKHPRVVRTSSSWRARGAAPAR